MQPVVYKPFQSVMCASVYANVHEMCNRTHIHMRTPLHVHFVYVPDCVFEHERYRMRAASSS